MNVPTKLGLFGAGLVLVFAISLVAGSVLGPDDGDGASPHAEETATGGHDDSGAALPGLSVSAAGTTFVAPTTTLAADVTQPFRFAIVDGDGAAVTAFVPSHERDLHLIVVSRDLTTYAHVHPTLSGDGTWTAALPPLRPGSYRALADFTAAGHDPVTLGLDLAVPGAFRPEPVPRTAATAEVDGYRVELEGTPTAGGTTTVALTVTRDGEPVTDLEPYLGALGHLVTLRHGDLAYLHVHPMDEGAETGGPTVRFGVEVPTAGTYRMFFDFSHGGTVRTAAFTVEVAA